MKKICLIIGVLLFAGFNLQAQNDAETLAKKKQDSIILAFPDFIEGSVIFKNGTEAIAPLNYNHYSQELLFKDPKDKEIKKVDNIQDILVVVIDDRLFVPVGKALAEVLVNDVVKLVYSKKVNVTEQKTGAYGTGGNTASISNVTSLSGSATGGGGSAQSQGGNASQSVSGATSSTSYMGGYNSSGNQLTFSSDVKFMNDERLFLLVNDKIVPITKKNLLKTFSKIKDFVSAYLEKQNPSLNNKEDMTLFISLCNGQMKQK